MGFPEPAELSASRLANLAVPDVLNAFETYLERFAAVTGRARERFEHCDWEGMLADATERLDLYSEAIARIERRIRDVLGTRADDRLAWASMKAVFSAVIAEREDRELAETFFNSLTRRLFTTIGVDNDIEFVDSDFDPNPDLSPGPILRRHEPPGGLEALVAAIVRGGGFEVRFRDLAGDAALVAQRLRGPLAAAGVSGHVHAEMLAAPFFRRKAAYLIGRLVCGQVAVPLAIALLNGPDGISVDAVLADEDDISILFSFTRSHFNVDLWPPSRLVSALRQLMPRKTTAEIYVTLGHHKHGKTLMYRDLLGHLRETDDSFELAAGTPGMVMVVFNMPGDDVVIKIIRDRIPAIKPVTPATVMRNYRFVFHHDRAGRLVEAHEFEHLEFDRSRFTESLLEEFKRAADRTVQVVGDQVVIHHAYIERRVTPLDVYLGHTGEHEARGVVADFGQAIKDLAASNIFPGELLPKNFGVTRHGRVTCYDYDELGPLTDFKFRDLPPPRVEEDDWGDEAWFGVEPRDVFPEEFGRFLGLSPARRRDLEESHPELFSAAYWTGVQDAVRRGELIDIFPYEASRRLHE